jgi:uncharacterized membrane protein
MQSLRQRLYPIRQEHGDFLLMLLLFFLFRLMMLMAYMTPCLLYCSDYLFYFEVANSVRQGQYPFIDFWFEFPPIFPYLSLGAYTLAQGTFQNYVSWVGFILLLFECGVLVLLYLLACHLYERKAALKLSWVYAMLFVPFYFWRSTFDSMTSFFILLALYGLLRKNYLIASLAMGLGFMVKYIPIILLPAIYRHSSLKRAGQALAAVVVVSLIIFGPFFIVSPEFSWASVRSQLTRSSWQTIWALIDGNLKPGDFGPVAYRFDLEKAEVSLYNPPKISPLLTLFVFGVIGFYVLVQPVRLPVDLDAARFMAFTIVIFFLWSRGWSPQWQVYLIPLALLSLPLRKALVYILALSIVNFLEWPLIYQRELIQLLPVTILSRTVLFGLLAYELYRLITIPQKDQLNTGDGSIAEVESFSV